MINKGFWRLLLQKMDVLTIIAFLLVVFLIVQAVRLFFADGDLPLMWAERFGIPTGVYIWEILFALLLSFGSGYANLCRVCRSRMSV